MSSCVLMLVYIQNLPFNQRRPLKKKGPRRKENKEERLSSPITPPRREVCFYLSQMVMIGKNILYYYSYYIIYILWLFIYGIHINRSVSIYTTTTTTDTIMTHFSFYKCQNGFLFLQINTNYLSSSSSSTFSLLFKKTKTTTTTTTTSKCNG